ncbi:MAG: CRTAC1 family protein [Abitibacteriaceae bacterium]|nr:CRTAC1 family protein [Abditibacteriaceae bacterium]MBV9867259.1 CRTAC1 family protein [Abditibacteriaceae bacterium]
MPETVGSGVAFLDYDNDGYQDIYLVNGRDWTDAEINAYKQGNGRKRASLVPPQHPHYHSTGMLLHNKGNGTFADATVQAGLNVEMYGMGVAVGDYDNDGRPDLFVTALDRNYLFHNETTKAGVKFRDVTLQAGLQDSAWSTGAAWVDYDRDGKLDLFVCHYIQWTPATDLFASPDGKNKSYIGPISYRGRVNRLYHNEGNGRFKDVSEAAGITHRLKDGRPTGAALVGKALGIAICDYNNDGWPDLIVTNDTQPNFLFRNNKNGTFSEVAVESNLAYNEAGKTRAGMGVDTADIDHSGRDTVVIGNFSNEMLGLYQNRGGLFMDMAPRSEVGQASMRFLTFGCAFLDYDNDGWPDILVANGHVDTDIQKTQPDIAYAERPLLFHNVGQGRFQEVGLHSGAALAQPLVARGLAYADIDLDGDLDVLLTTNGGAPHLLRNDGGNRNHSLRLVLQGTKSNRSAIGATVEVKVGQETLRRMVRSGSSYLSQSELPITFGLGQQAQAEAITIHWPAGTTTHLQAIAANQILFINEAKGIVKRLPFKRS